MKPSERDRRFIAYLGGLTARRAQVELAASLGRSAGESLRAVRWLAPWTQAMGSREFALHHLVAALHATHPAHAAQAVRQSHENLGATMARLARARGMTSSLERRFIALLEADADDLEHHLRRVVSLAKEADIPLDWAQLLTDVSYVNSIMETRSASGFVMDGCLE